MTLGIRLTPAQLAHLASIDSPTVANAIETFKVRDRCEGFIGGSIPCLFPELGVMLGYAITVTMDSRPGPVAPRSGYWRMWDELGTCLRPAVIVIQDVSGAPSRCAYFGEVMATIAARLGTVGVVTDGAVRDLAEVRDLRFHYFARYPVVSHANFEIVDVGVPVEIDGQVVRTGDLLHGDANGIVIVPPEVVESLPSAIARLREREEATLTFVRGTTFSLDELKRSSGY